MKTTFAGVVGCTMSEDIFRQLSATKVERYEWKKILLNEDVSGGRQYTGNAEIVENITSIIEDNDISIVFVSKNFLNVAPEIIKAGKSVRTV